MLRDADNNFLPQGYYKLVGTINNIAFTSREIDIIACVVNMRGSSKIASLLDISPRTAESHIANIKRKIDKTARENIIDFINKAGISKIIRNHYQYLLTHTEFQNKLTAIGKLICREKSITCKLYCEAQDNRSNKILLKQITQDLVKSGIKAELISIDFQQQFPHSSNLGEFRIYALSNEFLSQPELDKLSKNNCAFLMLPSKKLQLASTMNHFKLIKVEEENYYTLIFAVLKLMLPASQIEPIANEFRSLDSHNFDVRNLSSPAPPLANITSTRTQLDLLLRRYRKILLFLIASAIGIIVLSINQLGIWKAASANEVGNKNNLQSKELLSYIPELLTGYEKFIGRQEVLSQIDNHLQKNDIVVLTGRGGIGKSTCAAEYGKLQKNKWIIRYFNADSANKIDQKYSELAQEFNLNTVQQPKSLIMQLVNKKLSSVERKILFIFDNVEDYEDVKEYLNNLPVNVKAIITTRHPELITGKPHIDLKEFTYEETQEYLKNSLQKRHLTDEMVSKIAQSVSSLPYELKYATTFLLDNPLLNMELFDSEIGTKFKGKWFEQIATSKDKIAQQSWQILQYLAYLDPDFISMKIIQTIFGTKNSKIPVAIKQLEALSLVSIIQDNNCTNGLRIHRKLQSDILDFIKNHPQHSLDKKNLINTLSITLDNLFPEINYHEIQKRKIANGIQPHVKKLLGLKPNSISITANISNANLYFKMGLYYSELNINFKKALSYFKIALHKRQLLKNKKNVATCLNSIGSIYTRLGGSEKGLSYLIKGLELRKEEHKDKYNHDVASSLNELAIAYNYLGEPQKGLKYAIDALKIREKLNSGTFDDSLKISDSMSTIGASYIDLGDYTKAHQFFKKGLDIIKKSYGINHPTTAECLNNVAYTYSILGQHEEALKSAQSALQIYKTLYPMNYPSMVFSLNIYGAALVSTNSIEKGIEKLHEALNLCIDFGMDKHFINAFVHHNISIGHLKNKNYQKALQHAEQAFKLRKEIYEKVKNHIEISESLHNLGDIYKALRNRDKALEFYQQALEMNIKLSLDHLPETEKLRTKIKSLGL